jgi:RHS repeat-associated protein
MSRPPLTLVGVAALALVSLAPAAAARAAEACKDQLVQPPSLGLPERGSIAGSLSKLEIGAGELARGAFRLPLAIDTPQVRGPLLAQPFPSYSIEGGISEWGKGWGSELGIRRQRLLGDVAFDGTDDYTSPWGRLARGADGAYYPSGLQTVARLTAPADAGGAWVAILPDGTRHTFAFVDGKYAWMLTRVENVLGDVTELGWSRNASGRPFLERVTWGGRGGAPQYEARLAYEPIARPFLSFASGTRQLLDQRVARVTVSAWDGARFQERWHYVLGYTASPTGPAFYLTSSQRVFPAGAREPAVSFRYDDGTATMDAAQLQPLPGLDTFLALRRANSLQPDESTILDIDDDGLVDIESSDDYLLERQQPDGSFEAVALPPITGASPFCRSAPSTFNRPRFLARLRPGVEEPQVLFSRKVGASGSTAITICDRLGHLLAQTTVSGSWDTGPNVRLVDVDGDQQPDMVRVMSGSVQVLRNTSNPLVWSFAPQAIQDLEPAISPIATWVVDVNGDGKPDLLVRGAGGVEAYYGKGRGKFEKQGVAVPFLDANNHALANLNSFQLSHGDFNGDGLSDAILSTGRQAYVYFNRGDAYVERVVPGLAAIDFAFSLPMAADLSGKNNAEVVFVQGLHASSLALVSPATGLLTRVDDGKGTVVSFGYARQDAVPGIGQRAAVLAELSVTSAGRGTKTFRYAYARPVVHTLGRFLVGFGQAVRQGPLLREVAEFLNDDTTAGLLLASHITDSRTPGVEKFSETEVELASFHDLPWRRRQADVAGYRDVVSRAEVATRTDYEAYERDFCPVRSSQTFPGGVLTREDTLATVSALPADLSCLPAAQHLAGIHGDAALDFDYRVRLERDAVGALTRAAQLGPAGERVLQVNRYDGQHRLIASGRPGQGEAILGYDAAGRLSAAIAADGSSLTAGIDPVTDALTAITSERGGAAALSGFRYDELERLERSWSTVTGTSLAQPAERLGYRFATTSVPAAITSDKLVDAALDAHRVQADLLRADGEAITQATWLGTWALGRVQHHDDATMTTRGLWHAPLAGTAAAAPTATYAALATGTQVERRTEAGFERPADRAVSFERGVDGAVATTWSVSDGVLTERRTWNGSDVSDLGRDAAGHIVWRRDELGVVHRYAYDALGRLVLVVTPTGSHRVSYDAYGQVVRVQRDGLFTIEHAYDAVSGLETEKRVRAADGQLVQRTVTGHDAVGRVVAIDHDGGGEPRHFSIDHDGVGAGPGGTNLPGQLGYRSRVRGDGFERRERRDGLGQLVGTTWLLGGGWREVEETIERRADGTARARTLEVRDGAGHVLEHSVLANAVDAYGRVQSLSVNGAPVYTLAYDGEGRLARAQLPDGQALVPAYDEQTHARRGHTIGTATATRGGVTWHLDRRGRVAGESFTDGHDARERTYAYDARGQLVSSDDATGAARFGYSATGLPTSTSDSEGTRDVSLRVNGPGASGVAYTPDALVRVTRRGSSTFTYASDGQLAIARDGRRELRYAYDENGQRLLKRVDGTPTRAWVAGGLLLPEGLVVPIELDGVLVAVDDRGHLPHDVTHRRGTPFHDDTGHLAPASPYGVRSGARGRLAEAVDFARLGYDADLGTVRMGVRDYDPYLGQFWSADPLYAEDPARCTERPIDCNLFGYAGGSPLVGVDPAGTDWYKWFSETFRDTSKESHKGDPDDGLVNTQSSFSTGDLNKSTQIRLGTETYGAGALGLDDDGPSLMLGKHEYSVFELEHKPNDVLSLQLTFFKCEQVVKLTELGPKAEIQFSLVTVEGKLSKANDFWGGAVAIELAMGADGKPSGSASAGISPTRDNDVLGAIRDQWNAIQAKIDRAWSQIAENSSPAVATPRSPGSFGF